MKKGFLFFGFLFFSNILNAQALSVNASSFTSNKLEYNTGEIFVVYTFGNSQFSRETQLEETQLEENNFVVENPNQNKLIVYPNPVVDKIYYTFTDKEFDFKSIKIYDGQNKIIFETHKKGEEIDCSGFPTGVYWLMFNDNMQLKYKIIKL